MSHQQLDYEERLRAAGCRVTTQRLLILDAVCAGKGHTTLGEIYARVHRVDATIDRSTLYRTLKLLTRVGQVGGDDQHDGDTYYEIAKAQHHHHLVCRQCGNEQEIDDATLVAVFDQLFRLHGKVYPFVKMLSANLPSSS